MDEGLIASDPVGTNRATTARQATLGIGKEDRLGVCKIWTFKFCLSEIIDSDSKLGIKSLQGGSMGG